MATVQTLDNIRLSLEKHLGKRIILKANKGRKQIMTRRGILENVYPSVFIVKLEELHNFQLSNSVIIFSRKSMEKPLY